MTPHTWERVKDVFSEAVALELGERQQRLDEICSGDARLRAEVEALLRSNDESQDFIENPAFRVQDAMPPVEPASGKWIGPYRVEREIGRGGMGTVFLARREDGEFQQTVAIKVVSGPLLGRENLRRFRQERQILAGLNHPNIARLMDGGITGDGVPYLVMECVDGDPLIRFVEKKDLSLEERLYLFLKVCRALAYAHANLIVHRDIKPSNVLVTSDGEPKLLDFGLAKIMDIESDQLRTATCLRALTPAYASPEQLRGETITTSSDIYSLGVVLYELVTGSRPFDHESVTFEKMFRFVTVSEPERPSSKACGQTLSAKYRQALKGDIDNIVLMAMRKEPERRYRSVEQFADDIERHLKGLPVIAAEDSFIYRSSKFVKRHWIGVASAALTAVVLIGGIVGTAWQARKARQEQALAEETKTFLKGTLNYSNPLRTGKDINETTVVEMLDEAAKRLDGKFAEQPEIKAELELIIGKAYNGQGRNQLAIQHMEKYVSLERQLYGEDHPKTLNALSEWATLLFVKGDMQPADDTYARILPLMRDDRSKGTVSAESLATALNNYACLRRTQGDSGQAESLFREALDLSPQLTLEEWRVVNGTTRSTLASTLSDQGRFEEAIAESRRAVEEFIDRGETHQPDFAFTLTVLGGFLTEAGSFEEAETSLQTGETVIRKFLSPSSLWLGDNLRNQAILAYDQGKFADALDKTNQALRIYEETFGTHYDQYPTALITKGLSLAKTGHAKEGEAILREAVRLRTGSLPPHHYWVSLANSALGESFMLQSRFDEAEPLLTKSFDDLKRSQGEQNPRTKLAQRRVFELNQQWRKPSRS